MLQRKPEMRILHLPTPGAAVLHRYMRRFGCNDASIELHCDEPQNNSKPTDRAYATERTCAEQQQMVCVARRRTKGGERFHHNCEAPDRLMWNLLPPLNVTEQWPLAKMRAYAHGRFDVPTEGELRAVSCVGQPRSAQGSDLPRAGFRAPLGTWNLGTCPQFNTPFVR